MFIVGDLPAVTVCGLPRELVAANAAFSKPRKNIWEAICHRVGFHERSVFLQKRLDIHKLSFGDKRRPSGLHLMPLAFEISVTANANIRLVAKEHVEVVYGERPDSRATSASGNNALYPMPLLVEPFRRKRERAFHEIGRECVAHYISHFLVDNEMAGPVGIKFVTNGNTTAVKEPSCGASGKTSLYPFRNLLSLKLRNTRECEKHHFACGRCRIEIFPQTHERATMRLHEFPNIGKVLDGTRKTGKLGYDDEVYFATTDHRKKPLKLCALGVLPRLATLNEHMRKLAEGPFHIFETNRLPDALGLSPQNWSV